MELDQQKISRILQRNYCDNNLVQEHLLPMSTMTSVPNKVAVGAALNAARQGSSDAVAADTPIVPSVPKCFLKRLKLPRSPGS